MLLGQCQKAGVFGKELTEKPIGVLVGWPLPGAVRMTEVDRSLKIG